MEWKPHEGSRSRPNLLGAGSLLLIFHPWPIQSDMYRMPWVVLVLSLPLLVAGCTGDGPTGSAKVELEVETPAVALQPCQTRQLAATVTGSRNTAVLWSTSDSAVAVVTATGLVTAKGVGEATLSATAQADTSKRAAISVAVTASPLVVSMSGGGTDTIDARITQPVVARVTWAGSCAATGVTVRFSSPGAPIPPSNQYLAPAVYIAPNANALGTASGQADVRTDTLGHAAVVVRLGQTAGTFPVRATPLDAAGSADSALFTIRPGAPFRVSAAPADTAIYAGAAYVLRAQVADRRGNTPEETLTFASRRPNVAGVNGNGRVQAEATGRVYLVMRAGGLADSVALSVVPQGTLVAYTRRSSSGQTAALYLFDLDGSGYRAIVSGPFGFNTRGPRWLPSGDRVAFHDRLPNDPDPNHPLRLFITDLQGSVHELRPTIPGLEEKAGPQPSRDGKWIYFTGYPGYGKLDIWRIRPDGSGAERVNSDTAFAEHEYGPSPSPDGNRLAFITNRTPGQKAVIRILDVGTRRETPIDVRGTMPRWAPVGEEIAFLADGQVRVVRSDGTGMTILEATNRYDDIEGSVAWSPDAQWLVACRMGSSSGDRSLVIIRRSSGEVLPLAYTAPQRLCEADWRH